jgi:hypothetical protein
MIELLLRSLNVGRHFAKRFLYRSTFARRVFDFAQSPTQAMPIADHAPLNTARE